MNDAEVRTAAAVALGGIGPDAKSALPTLTAIAEAKKGKDKTLRRPSPTPSRKFKIPSSDALHRKVTDGTGMHTDDVRRGVGLRVDPCSIRGSLSGPKRLFTPFPPFFEDV